MEKPEATLRTSGLEPNDKFVYIWRIKNKFSPDYGKAGIDQNGQSFLRFNAFPY
jgi:hypothetical protein